MVVLHGSSANKEIAHLMMTVYLFQLIGAHNRVWHNFLSYTVRANAEKKDEENTQSPTYFE